MGGGLYFGRCLDPDGDDPVKSLVSGFAHSREHVSGNAEWLAAQVRGTAPEPPPDGFLVPPGMLEDLRNAIMDAYDLPRDLFKPGPPPTRRQRLRWKLRDWRNLAARRAYKIVAGHWPDDGEDDW